MVRLVSKFEETPPLLEAENAPEETEVDYCQILVELIRRVEIRGVTHNGMPNWKRKREKEGQPLPKDF